MKDEQGQAVIAASDQTDTLSAMLLQLPRELRIPIADDAASTSTAAKNAVSIDVSARKSASRSDVKLDMANTAPGKTDAAAIATDKRIITDDPLDADRTLARHVGLKSDLQLITSSTISAVMPNMLANNRPDNTAQTINTPLGNSGWAGDFSQKIIWMSTQKNQVVELHLNPPDLGPLNVVLKISDNQATALFTSPHGAVRDAVENALPKLRELLADNGITLGNTTVSDQSPRDRDAERFMNQGSATATQHKVSSEENLSTAAAQVASVRHHNGMVDTFA